jgi:hypothetical protein
MATTHALVAGQTVLSSDAFTVVISGKLSADMDPGSWVGYDGANDQWIPLDSDVAASDPLKGMTGVVAFRPRIDKDDYAEKTTASDYDVSEAECAVARICISGTVVCKIIDQNAAAYVGQKLTWNSDAENCTVLALTGVGGAGTGYTEGTALRAPIIGELAANYVDNDRYCIANIGQRIGRGAWRSNRLAAQTG